MSVNPMDGADRALTLQERIGRTVMNLLDCLAEDFPDAPIELETVGVVLALHLPQGAELNGETIEGEYGQSFLRFYCEDPRRWVQAGLFREAVWAADGR